MNQIKLLLLIILPLFLTLIYGGYSPFALFLMNAFVLLILCFFLFELNKKFSFKKTVLFLPILSFFCISLLSIFISINKNRSLEEILKISSYIIIYFVFVNSVEKKDVKYFIFSFIFIASLVSIYGIYQEIYGFKSLYLYLKEFNLPFPTRSFATFIHPNSLAGYLIMIIPLGIITYFDTNSLILKQIIAFNVILFIITFFLTYSRGGYFSLVLTLIFLFGIILYFQRKLFIKILLLIFILFLCSSLFFKTFTKKDINYVKKKIPKISLKETSVVGRFCFWKGSLRIIKKFPYLGTGIGTFSSIYPYFQERGFYSMYAHNNYLQTGAELGFLGFFIFVWFIIIVIRKGFLIVKKLNNNTYLPFGIYSGIIGFLLHTFIDFDWSIPAINLTLWYYLGILEVVGRNDLENKEFIVFKHKKVINFLIIFLTLFVITLCARPYLAYLHYEKGEVFYKKGKIKEAEKEIKMAIELNQMNAFYYSFLANIIKNRKEAISLIKKAISLEPYNAGYHSQLAYFYWNEKKNDLAIFELNLAQKLYPNCTTYYYYLGSIYLVMGKKDLAKKEFERVINLEKFYKEAGNPMKDIEATKIILKKIRVR